MISELTPEQESQISVIREKWRQIALSTQRVNRHKAVDAILAAYTIAGVKPSKIVFCNSPYTAFMYTSQEKPSWGEPTDLLGDELQACLERQLGTQLDIQLSSQLTEELKIELCRMDKPEDQQLLCNLPHMTWNLWMTLGQQLGREWWGFDAPSLIDPMQWASQWSWIDYCISVLGCSCDQTRWQAFQTLTQECGWVLPYFEGLPGVRSPYLYLLRRQLPRLRDWASCDAVR